MHLHLLWKHGCEKLIFYFFFFLWHLLAHLLEEVRKSEQAANWRKTNKTTSKTNWRIGCESLWVHSRHYKQEIGQAGPPSPRPEADVSESTGAGRGGNSSP